MLMSVVTVPVTEAKQRFTELVKGVEDYFDRYVVTKNGKEAAVVMSATEYKACWRRSTSWRTKRKSGRLPLPPNRLDMGKRRRWRTISNRKHRANPGTDVES